MFHSLHCANTKCKPFVCRVRNDTDIAVRHDANMADTDRNYLRQWREFRGFTQEELADRAETTKAVVSLLENEKRPLSSKWLRRFAEILDTRPGYILDLDPNELNSDIIDIWSRIDEREKDRAIRVLKSFATGTDD